MSKHPETKPDESACPCPAGHIECAHPTGLTKREAIAKVAMEGMLSNSGVDTEKDIDFVSKFSVRYADALIAGLTKNNMKTYYILSLKHSPLQGDAVWWGPNDAGYFRSLDSAGVYTQQQIDCNKSYYDNGESTLAVECAEAQKLSHRSVDWCKLKTEMIPLHRA